MTSDMLFQYLGVKAHPWKKGFPLKVVGILPVKTERNTLWKILHACIPVLLFINMDEQN